MKSATEEKVLSLVSSTVQKAALHNLSVGFRIDFKTFKAPLLSRSYLYEQEQQLKINIRNSFFLTFLLGDVGQGTLVFSFYCKAKS